MNELPPKTNYHQQDKKEKERNVVGLKTQKPAVGKEWILCPLMKKLLDQRSPFQSTFFWDPLLSPLTRLLAQKVGSQSTGREEILHVRGGCPSLGFSFL